MTQISPQSDVRYWRSQDNHAERGRPQNCASRGTMRANACYGKFLTGVGFGGKENDHREKAGFRSKFNQLNKKSHQATAERDEPHFNFPPSDPYTSLDITPASRPFQSPNLHSSKNVRLHQWSAHVAQWAGYGDSMRHKLDGSNATARGRRVRDLDGVR